MLKTIKTIHTIIWAIMAFACIYTLYSGIMGLFDLTTKISIGIIIFEGLVLLINKGFCPLTFVARKYTTQQSDNFDIYLPEFIARYNKWIFGITFSIGLILVILRQLL